MGRLKTGQILFLLIYTIYTVWDWQEVRAAIPLDRFDRIVSSNPDEVRFYLYSPGFGNWELHHAHEMDYNNISTIIYSGLRKSNLSVKFLIHGFAHNYQCWFPQEVKDVYFSRGFRGHIVVVDWGRLAMPNATEPVQSLAYPLVVRNVRVAGRRISDFISLLLAHNLIQMSQIHIVGFSLGAHIGGWLANDLFLKYNEKIPRLSAGPLFYTGWISRRMRKSDSLWTDVVHTDMTEYGSITPLGHADFFVNGGLPSQPGCRGNASCSHQAAPRFWIQAIGQAIPACNCASYYAFKSGACKCNRISLFGDSAQPGAYGSFFLDMPRLQPLSGKYSC